MRGQYGEGQLADQTFAAYRDEPNVAKLHPETFVAGKFLIDNFRWSGVLSMFAG